MNGLPDVLVVDASVAAKWYLAEDLVPHAFGVLESEADLAAPDLLLIEVGNILWKRVRTGDMALAEAATSVRALRRLAIELHSPQRLLVHALEIAVAHDRTVYDALYVALAVNLDTVLVTADQRLHNAIAAGPLADHTLLLTQVPPAPAPDDSAC